jgi:hypothetical protein
MALYNIHGKKRMCTRCSREDAKKRVKSEWLGVKCLEKRKKRQEQEQEQKRLREIKKCICGEPISVLDSLCEVCFDKKDFENEILNAKTVPELTEILLQLAKYVGKI